MKKEVKATFTLTDSEIREALYDFYVRKLKANNINACFSPAEIVVEIEDDLLEVWLIVTEEKEIE